MCRKPGDLKTVPFSNGAAVADFDNDGDLDMVINNLDGTSDLYENDAESKNNYLRVKLHGPDGNRDGIGARVSLFYGGRLQQFFQQKTVRGYLSSNEPIIHFGIGSSNKVDSVVVVWPDQKSSTLKSVNGNQVVKADYKDAVSGKDYSTKYTPLFAEQTQQLLTTPFLHKENKVDEYKDQVLLPHEFSRSGPFIATGDVNADGQEDFFCRRSEGTSRRTLFPAKWQV
jgi:hypothetical protein